MCPLSHDLKCVYSHGSLSKTFGKQLSVSYKQGNCVSYLLPWNKFSALKQKQVTFPLVQESGSGLARWFWLWVSHEVEVELLSGPPTSGAQSRIWSQSSLRSSVLSSLPCSPLHLHDGGSSLPKLCDPRERQGLRWEPASSITCSQMWHTIASAVFYLSYRPTLVPCGRGLPVTLVFY